MKRKIGIAVVVTLIAIVTAVISSRNHRIHYDNVATEIDSIVTQKYATQCCVAEIPPELAEMIAADPDYVIVCLVVAQARHWPQIAPDEEQRILAKAKKNSSEALEDLKRCIYDGVTRQMVKHGYNSTKERRAWYCNNPSTGILFTELPIAEYLGKKVKWITEEINGNRDHPLWYEPELSFEQYISWHNDN